ncbi:hypothetical protein [Bacillus thuringiensis]
MERWIGSAAVCVNEKNEVLMVLQGKEGITYGVPVYVHYYFVKQIGGNMKIQDPDELIHEIAWKRIHEVEQLCLAFPEDYELLYQYINKEASM